MEIFSALLAICAGNSPVTGEFPTQRPVTRSFDVYFDLRPKERLSKQWWGWWFETLSRSLWRHRNDQRSLYLSQFQLLKHISHRASYSWWRHQMETFSALLAICAGNSPVTGEFPTQRPVTRSFDVYFDLRPKERLSKQWWGWWFETLSRSLWRHRNDQRSLYLSQFQLLKHISHRASYYCRHGLHLKACLQTLWHLNKSTTDLIGAGWQMHQWTRPPLTQIMTWHLFGA